MLNPSIQISLLFETCRLIEHIARKPVRAAHCPKTKFIKNARAFKHALCKLPGSPSGVQTSTDFAWKIHNHWNEGLLKSKSINYNINVMMKLLKCKSYSSLHIFWHSFRSITNSFWSGGVSTLTHVLWENQDGWQSDWWSGKNAYGM